jgi:hypothetical protein
MTSRPDRARTPRTHPKNWDHSTIKPAECQTHSSCCCVGPLAALQYFSREKPLCTLSSKASDRARTQNGGRNSNAQPSSEARDWYFSREKYRPHENRIEQARTSPSRQCICDPPSLTRCTDIQPAQLHNHSVDLGVGQRIDLRTFLTEIEFGGRAASVLSFPRWPA